MMRAMMPALLLLALMNATQPALGSGLVPVCTRAGVSWTTPDGKPAERDVRSPAGVVVEKAGTVRDGGSYEQRMGRVACWNSVMDENAYLIRKWNEFIVA